MKVWKSILIVVLLALCIISGKYFWDFYMIGAKFLMWLTLATGLVLFFLAVFLPLYWLFQMVLKSNKDMILRVRDRFNLFVSHDFNPLSNRVSTAENNIAFLDRNVNVLSNDYLERSSLEPIRIQTLANLCGEKIDKWAEQLNKKGLNFPENLLMDLLSLDDDSYMTMDFEDFFKYFRNTGFSKVKFGDEIDLDNLFTPNMGGKTREIEKNKRKNELTLLQLAISNESVTGKMCNFLFHHRYPNKKFPNTKRTEEMVEFTVQNQCPECSGKAICEFYPLYEEIATRLNKELYTTWPTRAPAEPISDQNEAIQFLAEQHKEATGERCMFYRVSSSLDAGYGGKNKIENLKNFIKVNNCSTCEGRIICEYYPTYVAQIERLKKSEAEEKIENPPLQSSIPEECLRLQNSLFQEEPPSVARMNKVIAILDDLLDLVDCSKCGSQACVLLKKKDDYENEIRKMLQAKADNISSTTPPSNMEE